MQWDSPAQINIYFGLNVSSEEPEEIRKAVVRKMADIHPDNNGSVFPNTEVENEWHELMSAKKYFDETHAESQLIPLNQVTSIVKAIGAANVPSIDTRISLLKQDARLEAKYRITTPRISSGTIAAVCGFLFTISEKLASNSLIGSFFSQSVVQFILLVSTMISGIFFVFTWTNETVLERNVEYLSSEESGKYILSRLYHSKLNKEGHKSRRFTLNELIDSLLMFRNHDRMELSGLYRTGKLTPTMAEKIAILQTDRYKSRGVIVELQNIGFDRVFEISNSVMNEFEKYGFR